MWERQLTCPSKAVKERRQFGSGNSRSTVKRSWRVFFLIDDKSSVPCLKSPVNPTVFRCAVASLNSHRLKGRPGTSLVGKGHENGDVRIKVASQSWFTEENAHGRDHARET